MSLHAAAAPSPDLARAGLTQPEAEQRLRRFGPNEIAERTQSPLRRFFAFFWGPLPWLMESAAALALALHAWGAFWVILANLVLNALIAFWEELRADRAITSLRAQLAPRAHVRRDGTWKVLAARDLVPGDVIRVQLGDVVPADVRLLSGGGIALDRSSLTGESLPIECAPDDILQAGTVVRRGAAEAQVTATGSRIHFADTIRLVQKTVPVGHIQRVIVILARDLILFALALDLALLVVAFLRHDDFAAALEYALLLAVGAVPVSMPTVFAVTMAAGAQRLLRKSMLVSRLSALEELAAMDSLWVDKTGTLTQNLLTAGEPFCLPPATRDDVLRDAALASAPPGDSDLGSDPVDAAIRRAYGDEAALQSYDVVEFIPFDSDTKRAIASLRTSDGVSVDVAKGAVQAIFALARATPSEQEHIERAVDAFARRGFRSLAVVSAFPPGTWHIQGVIPLYDPIRPDAAQAVADMQAQGVAVKLLTGDQRAIGREVAHQLGLGANLLDTSALDAAQSPAAIEAASGFAQVLPADKYRIVEASQQAGHIVGMTGDGVNDTPALRRADVGIAVQGASEAARAASDLVIVKAGLSVLAEAIVESRRIFGRMRTYVTYRVAETMRRLLSLTIAVVAFSIYPLTPAMLALLATFNALVLVALAYDQVLPSTRPERWHMREALTVAGALSVVSLCEFFGLFFLAQRILSLSHAEIQTLLYLALSAAGYFTLLVTRTRGPFWSVRPAPVLLLAMGIALGLGYIVALVGWLMPALGWQWVLLALGYSALWFVVADVVKIAVYRWMPPSRSARPSRR